MKNIYDNFKQENRTPLLDSSIVTTMGEGRFEPWTSPLETLGGVSWVTRLLAILPTKSLRGYIFTQQ